MPVSLTETPDLRQQIIASAIQATYDRLGVPAIDQPNLSALSPHQVAALTNALRRLIDQRCPKGAKPSRVR